MTQKKRGGLGRGLSALIPAAQQEDVPKSPSSPLDVFFSGNVSRETIEGSVAEGDEDVAGGKSAGKSGAGDYRASSDNSGQRPAVGHPTDGPAVLESAREGSGATQEGPGPASEGSGSPDLQGESVSSGDLAADTESDSANSVKAAKSAARSLLSAPPRTKRKLKKKTAKKQSDRDTRRSALDENVSRETISESDHPKDVSRETIPPATDHAANGNDSDNGQYGPVLYHMVKKANGKGGADSARPRKHDTSAAETKDEHADESSEGVSTFAENAEKPQELSPVPGATFGEIPVWSIVANREQPRTEFAENELKELVQSVSEVGVLQPIVVRPLPIEDQDALYEKRLDRARKRELFRYHNAESLVAEQDSDARERGDLEQLLSVSDVKQIGKPRYELVMGERRLRASRMAELETIPAIVRHTEDQDVLRDALLENLHRVQLNPIEEAAAYQQLLDDFACTQEALSQKVARSRPQIANMLRLLNLPSDVQRKVAAGTLSMGHARAILALKGAEARIHLAERVIREHLSVRATEQIAASGNPFSAANGKKRQAGSRLEVPEKLQSYATSLGDSLDTSVNVQIGKKKCKIVIEAADSEDLERLMRLLNR